MQCCTEHTAAAALKIRECTSQSLSFCNMTTTTDNLTSEAPFAYMGGKSRLREWIYQHMPRQVYHLVDVFGGAGNVVLGYKGASFRTYNDSNGELVNLMRMLREKGPELISLLELTPHSREEYMSSFEDCEDALEQARRTFVKLSQSFGRTLVRSGFSSDINNGRYGISEATLRHISRIDKLPEVVRALRTICIENLDYKDLLMKYQGPKTYFYLDPPYIWETRTGRVKYRDELNTVEKHIELLELLVKVECQGFMLSCYDHPIYEQYLGHLHKQTKQASTNGGASRIETIYFTKSVKGQCPIIF